MFDKAGIPVLYVEGRRELGAGQKMAISSAAKVEKPFPDGTSWQMMCGWIISSTLIKSAAAAVEHHRKPGCREVMPAAGAEASAGESGKSTERAN